MKEQPEAKPDVDANARRIRVQAQILPLRAELAGCKSPVRRRELRAEINALRLAVTP